MALNTEGSVVDYLKSKGQDSSYTARTKLAADNGISGYTGSADQNNSLLKILAAGGNKAVAPGSASIPTPGTVSSLLNSDVPKVNGIFDLSSASPNGGSLIHSPDSPISSTEGLRTNEEQTKAGAGEVLNTMPNLNDLMSKQVATITDATTYGATDAGKTAMSDLETIRRNLGITSAAEEASIKKAGAAEGANYDSLISDAQQQKRKGLSKSVVSAGEQGGFMNTQQAGIAALRPTEGNDFIGNGGTLEDVQSVYDNSISKLQVQKQQAIVAAEASAREALRTGKQANLDNALKLLDVATKAHDSAIALANEKVNAIGKFQEMQKTNQADALDKITKIGETGGDIPDELKKGVDAIYGPGWSDKYAAAQKAAKDAKNLGDNADAAKKISDALKGYPKGKKIKFGDNIYEATGDSADNQTFSETDSAGNVTFVTIDKATGEMIGNAKGGKIGQGKVAPGGLSTTVSPEIVKGILDSRGADGYVNTGKYAAAYDQAAQQGAKALKDFTDRMPPKTYLNPKDATASRFIQTNTQVNNEANPAKYTSKNIPTHLQQEILQHIKDGANLDDIEATYPDVDVNLVQDLYYQ